MTDIRSIISRHILLPQAEKIYGSKIINSYNMLLDREWQRASSLQDYRNEKLRSLVQYCSKHVPYYTRLFNEHGINPMQIQSEEDLKTIPILTKQIIRDNFSELVSTVKDKRRSKLHSTGGSTGTPLQFYSDIDSWSMLWGSTFRAWKWFGLSYGEKIFTVGGHSLVSKRSLIGKDAIFQKWIMRNVKYSCSDFKSGDFLPVYKALIKERPSAVRGYPTTLYMFARYLLDNELDVPSLKVVLTTGEVLVDSYRRDIQKAFRVPVCDSYGAGDGGIATHECPMHEGLHVTSEKCCIEIVDKNGNLLSDGEVGHVLSTDLDNFVFPFVRYQVGDMASYRDGFCSCGRETRLLGPIMGRSGKLLYNKQGVALSPTMLPIMLYPELDYFSPANQIPYNKIDRFMIKQDESGDILVLLQMKKNAQWNENEYNYVNGNYKSFFIDSEINVAFVDCIPDLPSGKQDYVVSSYKP